jgi:TrmH family RNA methyltransferase
MPEFKIIFVGPEYPINLGYCARVLANFGYGEMHLVKPKARIDKTAVMHAKHAGDLLKNAKVYASLEEATRDCDFVVGTSGIIKRGKKTFRNPLNIEQFVKRVKRTKKRFGILFGREGTGLSIEEIGKCDLLVSIPADKRYPVLNISHALAIVLYSVSGTSGHHLIKNAKRAEKEELVKTFAEITDFYKPQLRNSEKIKSAFKRVVGRSLVSDIEAAALLCVVKKAKEEIKRARAREMG